MRARCWGGAHTLEMGAERAQVLIRAAQSAARPTWVTFTEISCCALSLGILHGCDWLILTQKTQVPFCTQCSVESCVNPELGLVAVLSSAPPLYSVQKTWTNTAWWVKFDRGGGTSLQNPRCIRLLWGIHGLVFTFRTIGSNQQPRDQRTSHVTVVRPFNIVNNKPSQCRSISCH